MLTGKLEKKDLLNWGAEEMKALSPWRPEKTRTNEGADEENIRAITHQNPFLFIGITSTDTGKFRKL